MLPGFRNRKTSCGIKKEWEMCSYPQGHRDPGEKQLKLQHHAVTRISPITARV